MLFLGEKQCTWTNKMMDDLISSAENCKTLMEFEGKYYRKNYVKNMRVLGRKFLKTENDADQTNLEARCLTKVETDSMYCY